MNLKVGARASRLSLAQSEILLAQISTVLKDLRFELVPFHTTGDKDRQTELGKAPDDFFTDVLDFALLKGDLDFAIHSAKDLPDTTRDGLDFFVLPWSEDPRDALLMSSSLKEIPACPRVGVSSSAREAYALKRWANARLQPIRGNIDERIQQMDQGKFDLMFLALAGLKRLGLTSRILQEIPMADLPTHPMQGKIAITYQKQNSTLQHIRYLLEEKNDHKNEAPLTPSFEKGGLPLKDLKILIPGSKSTRDVLLREVSDLGGEALPLEVFKLIPLYREIEKWAPQLKNYDWVLISSASAAQIFLDEISRKALQLAKCPQIAVSGPAAQTVFANNNLTPAFMPSVYTSQALGEELIATEQISGKKILLLRSSASKNNLAQILQEAGAVVESFDLYQNETLALDDCPQFDIVLFSSPSAVKPLSSQYPAQCSSAKIASIGPLTTAAIEKEGLKVDVQPAVYDTYHLVRALASHILWADKISCPDIG